MPVNLSVRGVPDEIVERLRERAKQNHRSLQGELMAILEESVERRLTLRGASARLKYLTLRGDSDSTKMIREDRDRSGG